MMDFERKEPKKESSTCDEPIAFGDDYGDNETTFHCQLPEGHPGDHEESGDMYGTPYVLKWGKNDNHR